MPEVAFAVGRRVKVKSTIGPCPDASHANREHHAGTVGEVVQMGKDGPAICPPGAENCLLVDSGIKDGNPVPGRGHMREWISPDDLDIV